MQQVLEVPLSREPVLKGLHSENRPGRQLQAQERGLEREL
jgi:hypothetical protein